jgi:hypothetical protein
MILGCVLALGTAALLHAAQPLSLGLGTKVTYRDFYEPPNQSKLRAFVQGSKAVPEGKDRLRISDVHIDSYRESGEAEAVVTAPDCIYDHKARTIGSDGPIKAQTADGQMRIEGVGFSLSLTNKSLTISNNVRTVIRDLGTNLKKP